MKRVVSILLVLAMVMGFVGCGTKKKESDKLQIYTSFYAMYDFARMVAGDNADVHLLCPVGAEPHDYEPTTADIAKLTEADIFIYNGGGMEHWAEKVAGTLGDTRIICASEGLTDSKASDPHVWLDPIIALEQMKKIHDVLVELDPVNAPKYSENYGKCDEMVLELDLELNEVAANSESKTIVVAHSAYGYLCDRYGIEQIAIENASGDNDPSPAAMAAIVDKAKKAGIKYVCAEELNSGKVVETVAKEIGAEVVTLNPFEGSADNKGYFVVMDENLKTLKKVLN